MLNNSKFMDLVGDNVFEAKFTKKDGSERIMIATVNLNLIPSEQHPENPGRYIKEDVVRVFDLQKQGWRSINLATLEALEQVQYAKMSSYLTTAGA